MIYEIKKKMSAVIEINDLTFCSTTFNNVKENQALNNVIYLGD